MDYELFYCDNYGDSIREHLNSFEYFIKIAKKVVKKVSKFFNEISEKAGNILKDLSNSFKEYEHEFSFNKNINYFNSRNKNMRCKVKSQVMGNKLTYVRCRNNL